MARCPSVAFVIACCTLTCVLVGCGPTVKDRLAGQWKGTLELDPAAVDRKVAAASDPVSAMIGKAGIMALSSQMQVDMDLKPDGTFSSDARLNKLSEKTTGTWAVTAADEKQATITVTEKSATRAYVIQFDPDFMQGTGGFQTPTWGEFEGLGQVKFTRVTP